MQNSENKVAELLTEAFEILKECDKSRENSLVITKVEEAAMWHNKDRAIKGLLEKNDTHLE